MTAWSGVRTRLRALRAFSLPVSMLPVLVATAAVRPLAEWHWGLAGASVAVVALLHAAGNLLNDCFDFRYGVDRRVAGDESRPGRVLVKKQLAPRDVIVEAAACLLLASPLAGYLLWQCGPRLLWFGLGATFALYAYTGPPFRFKHRALGEVLVFLNFGPLLMVGAAYAQTGRIEPAALLLSLPVGFITTAILVGNNIRDRAEDRRAGIVTIACFAKGIPARVLYVALVTAAVGAIAAMGAAGLGPAILLGAPAMLVLLYRPLKCVWQDERLADIDAKTAKFESVLLAFVLLSLLADRLLTQTPTGS